MSRPLFDASLLAQDVVATVPAGLELRPLASDDYARGHLSVLAHLTASPDVGEPAWSAQFARLAAINTATADDGPTYLPVVVVDRAADEIVASASLVVERKFLRGAAKCGHVEDVVVDPRLQGKKLGLLLLTVLTRLSESQGCYKTILDCDPKNEAFYVKCGYENKGCEMAKYAEKK
ncbi:hypothetical protein JCM11491_006339 [Sporobolomyces phaffii]